MEAYNLDFLIKTKLIKKKLCLRWTYTSEKTNFWGKTVKSKPYWKDNYSIFGSQFDIPKLSKHQVLENYEIFEKDQVILYFTNDFYKVVSFDDYESAKKFFDEINNQKGFSMKLI